MGCGASTVEYAEPIKQKKIEKSEKKKRKRSSSSCSSDSSSDEECGEGETVITKTLLREYLDREINMLKLELTQPEVVLKQLLEQKELTTQQLIKNSEVLKNQREICMREYRDLTNLQQLIQQKQPVGQDTWDVEQKEYVEAYNKHKQLEETHEKLAKQSQEIDTKIKQANMDVKRLLKLRTRQDGILIKAFGGSYGSEKEAEIEEYVDRMKEFKRNILNTKAQWKRGHEFTKAANVQYWRAVQVWNNILQSPQAHVRWQYCSYVVNYLNAAYTNSSQAVSCIRAHAQVPYFTQKMFQEVEISRRNAYTACQPRFHATFLQWLWYYQQNAAYLEKWIQKTLDQTIEGDLTKVNGYLSVAESDLRNERKRLIIEKVNEKFGNDANNEVAEQEAEVTRLSEELKKMKSVAVHANIATVDAGVGSDSDEGPPPVPNDQDPSQKQDEEMNVTVDVEGVPLGIEIVGGTDSPTSPNDNGIYISSVDPKGAAAKNSGLLVGDKITSVNGVSLEGVTRGEALEALAKGGSNVILIIIRPAPQIAKETNAAELSSAAEEAAREAEEEARKRQEEEEAAKIVQEESRKRLEEAQQKMAELEAATEELEAEKAEAEKAAKEAEEKRQAEEAATAAQIAAEEAAAKAAAEEKEQMLLEAKQAAEAAEKAKAEAQKWSDMAKEAAAKAEAEMEASKQAVEERLKAEEEAREAAESAERAKSELDRIAEAAASAKEEQERLAKVAEEEKRKSELELAKKEKEQAEETPAPVDLQSDIDNIMKDYKNSVEQYNKKRGTEETRMDLDLQEKLRMRRQRRRQQMKQKLQEQKLLAAQEDQQQS